MPKVSIIIPVFNGEVFLKRCLSSIQSQSFADFEAIVINDGSSDGSAKIVQAFAERDSRFRIVSQPANGGAAAARNLGLREAGGELIQFIDADDEVCPDLLSEMLRLLTDADCVICGYRRLTQSGREIERFQAPSGLLATSDDWSGAFDRLYRRYLISSVCNKLYRRKIVRNASLGFDPALPIGEDLLFNYAYLSRCRRVAVTDKILYSYYHTGGHSLTASRLRQKPEIDRRLYRATQTFCELIGIDHSPSIYEIYLKSCFTSIERMIFPKSVLPRREVEQVVRGILESEETKTALAKQLDKSLEARLYQRLLRAHSNRLLLGSAWVRGAIKALIQC